MVYPVLFQMKKNLLELFVFVLHENRAIDDIDNANRISATRCNLRCGFVAIIRVGFKYYIPDLETKKNSCFIRK